MYTEYLSSQQEATPEAPSRQASPRRAAPRRRDPRRDRQRRVLLTLAALVLLLAGFASGCCVGRAYALSSNTESGSTGGADISVKSPQQKSNVPASITLPD